jgi:hypothetical protein
VVTLHTPGGTICARSTCVAVLKSTRAEFTCHQPLAVRRHSVEGVVEQLPGVQRVRVLQPFAAGRGDREHLGFPGRALVGVKDVAVSDVRVADVQQRGGG